MKHGFVPKETSCLAEHLRQDLRLTNEMKIPISYTKMNIAIYEQLRGFQQSMSETQNKIAVRLKKRLHKHPTSIKQEARVSNVMK